MSYEDKIKIKSCARKIISLVKHYKTVPIIVKLKETWARQIVRLIP